MAKQIADSFLYKGKKPLDLREQFDTVLSMKSFPESYIPEGFLTYCVEDGKNYRYKSTNPVSETTGKWKEEVADAKVYAGYYRNIQKLEPYAYEVWYDELNYAFAYNKFEDNLVPTGCSSVWNKKFAARNLDWYYNTDSDFLIHTSGGNGRYATIGTCGQISKLSMDFVDSGDYAEEFALLPFYCVDGINEKGLYINVNVVPAEVGNTEQFIFVDDGNPKVTICANMIPRYILDHCSGAYEAAQTIKNDLKVYFSKKLKTIGYEPHFMVADKETCFIVEFINNEVVVKHYHEITGYGENYMAMTNFHMTPVTGWYAEGNDYPVSTPANRSSMKPTDQGITPTGAGLERFNLLMNSLRDAGPDTNPLGAMVNARYTYAYQPNAAMNGPWYTEFVGIDGLTVDSMPAEFNAPGAVMERAQAKFQNRSRDISNPNFGTWQTTHTVGYDLDSLTATWLFQDVDGVNQYDRGIELDNTKKELALRNHWIVGHIYNRITLKSPDGYEPVDYTKMTQGLTVSCISPENYDNLDEIMLDGYTWSIRNADGGFSVKKGDKLEFYFVDNGEGDRYFMRAINEEEEKEIPDIKTFKRELITTLPTGTKNSVAATFAHGGKYYVISQNAYQLENYIPDPVFNVYESLDDEEPASTFSPSFVFEGGVRTESFEVKGVFQYKGKFAIYGIMDLGDWGMRAAWAEPTKPEDLTAYWDVYEIPGDDFDGQISGILDMISTDRYKEIDSTIIGIAAVRNDGVGDHTGMGIGTITFPNNEKTGAVGSGKWFDIENHYNDALGDARIIECKLFENPNPTDIMADGIIGLIKSAPDYELYPYYLYAGIESGASIPLATSSFEIFDVNGVNVVGDYMYVLGASYPGGTADSFVKIDTRTFIESQEGEAYNIPEISGISIKSVKLAGTEEENYLAYVEALDKSIYFAKVDEDVSLTKESIVVPNVSEEEAGEIKIPYFEIGNADDKYVGAYNSQATYYMGIIKDITTPKFVSANGVYAALFRQTETQQAESTKELVHRNNWDVSVSGSTLRLKSPTGFEPYNDIPTNGMIVEFTPTSDQTAPITKVKIDNGVEVNVANYGFSYKAYTTVKLYYTSGMWYEYNPHGLREVEISNHDDIYENHLVEVLFNYHVEDAVWLKAVEYGYRQWVGVLIPDHRSDISRATFIDGLGVHSVRLSGGGTGPLKLIDLIEGPIAGSNIDVDYIVTMDDDPYMFKIGVPDRYPVTVLAPGGYIKFTATKDSEDYNYVFIDNIFKVNVYGPKDEEGNRTQFTVRANEKVTLLITDEKEDGQYILEKVQSKEGTAYTDLYVAGTDKLEWYQGGPYSLYVNGKYEGVMTVDSEKAHLVGMDGTGSCDLEATDETSPYVMGIIETSYPDTPVYPWFTCTSGGIINWGDDTEEEYRDNLQHIYAVPGQYKISATNVDKFNGPNPNQGFLDDLHIVKYLYVNCVGENIWDGSYRWEDVDTVVFSDPEPNVSAPTVYILKDASAPKQIVFPPFSKFSSLEELRNSDVFFAESFNDMRPRENNEPTDLIFFGLLPYFPGYSSFASFNEYTHLRVFLPDANFEEYRSLIENDDYIRVGRLREYGGTIEYHKISELGKTYESYLKRSGGTPNTISTLVESSNTLEKLLEILTTGTGV